MIKRVDWPFRLPHVYLMSNDAINDEPLSPVGLREELTEKGLVGIDFTIEEFEHAQRYGRLYLPLSIYDRLALAIAKNRQIKLLTGDGSLRKVAMTENVTVVGTLGILDQLLAENCIEEQVYIDCLRNLKKQNGRRIRLPEKEIILRLRRSERTG